jgi:transcriptional regulator with PAS, ATPase and Fis domain
LFGHERGSFTGADRMRRGAFEMADGGTLFLDEVGEMPPAFQAKLLRVLQPPPGAAPTARELFRVGSERPLRSDARVISATNTDLFEAVATGRFREDLMERLQVISVHLPPLRERREDVPELVEHFMKRYCRQEDRPVFRLDPSVLKVLQAFDYPRNVRELESAIRSIVTMKEAGDTVVLGDLPLKFFESGEDASPQEASPLVSLAELERVHIERVLAATGGNKARAARILGISRPTLDRRIRRHGIGGTPSVPPK